MATFRVKVTAKSGLNYRSSPSTSGKKKGVYKYNKILTIDKESNGWYRVKSKNVWVIKKYTKKINTKTNNGSKNAGLTKAQQRDVDASTMKDVGTYDGYNDSQYNNAFIKSISGIFGLPYQFMPSVDARLTKSDKRKKTKGDIKRKELSYGRKYNEKIITKMPLLLISPGYPNFLPTFNKNQKLAIMKVLESSVGNISKSISTTLSSIMGSKVGRYYTFNFDYSSYYRYVNIMLQTCAKFLKIHNVMHGNSKKGGYRKKLGSFNWSKYLNNDFQGFISAKEVVAFYVDAESSVNETFSTSTTVSQYASSINGITDTAREIGFLLGPVAGIRKKAADPDAYNEKLKSINNSIDKYLGGSKLFKNLSEAITTVTNGGKLVFPELWEDTEFSKSYDVNIKLRTPDGDTISWYLNILVPLIHLIALAAPRQMGANGYKSPFIVRAFYKGIFNCDMGIITSLNITKGREGAWTIENLPTEVDIAITIKDLYSLLFITNDYNVSNFLNNTCLTDYLANSCGININKPEIQRSCEMFLMLNKNKITNIPNNIFTSLEQFASNVYQNLYNKTLF